MYHRNCKYYHSLSFIFWFCLWWFWSTENWGLSNWLYWFFLFVLWLAFTTLLERPSLFQRYIFVLPSLFPLHLWSSQIIGLRQVSVILTMVLSWLIMVIVLQRPFFCSAWGRKEFLYVSHRTTTPTLDWTFFKLKVVSSKKLSNFKACWGDEWMSGFSYALPIVYACSDHPELNIAQCYLWFGFIYDPYSHCLGLSEIDYVLLVCYCINT